MYEKIKFHIITNEYEILKQIKLVYKSYFY